MSVETDFYSAITGDGTISALIGTRLYPAILPDDVTFPAMVYTVISDVPTGSGICLQSRVQVDCYAVSYATVKAMRDAVLALNKTTVSWSYVGGSDFYEDDSELYRQEMDILVSHEV